MNAGRRAPAEAAIVARLGTPGDAPSSAALTLDVMAACLRGHARACDGAAFALLQAVGFAPADIAAALPHARRMAANIGA